MKTEGSLEEGTAEGYPRSSHPDEREQGRIWRTSFPQLFVVCACALLDKSAFLESTFLLAGCYGMDPESRPILC